MDYSNYAQQFSSMDTTTQIATIICMLVVALLSIIAEWKIFTKAGEKGWYSLIPILREYTLVKIADGNGVKFLLFLIPFVNLIYGILLDFRLASAYGKGTGFALGLIFLPNLFLLILGFGKAEYIGPRGEQQPLATHQ